jgi:hypothetical protein
MPKECPRCFECFATSSIESALSPSDAYLEIESSPPVEGTVAIPALSYPRFFKIVNPSSKNSRASVCFSVPITPTIPQQSVFESDRANAVVAAATASKADAFDFFHMEEYSDSEDAEDDSEDTARTEGNFADDLVDRC